MANEYIPAVSGYEDLLEAFAGAYHQATGGKGAERHANNRPFKEQPIFNIARDHGLAFLTGQAAKKLGEAHTLLELRGHDAAIKEIYGAIVYAAAATIYLKERTPDPAADIRAHNATP